MRSAADSSVARRTVPKTGKVIYKDWTMVGKGTRTTSKFLRYAAAGFLKDISSIGHATHTNPNSA